MSQSFDRLLDFVRLLNEFRNVERIMFANGHDRNENDVEHSYHLAMLAWFIVSHDRLSLDIDKVIRYALIHDFVEVYAGDTFLFSIDADHLESKEKREHEALEKLIKEWGDFPELHESITSYEGQHDPEGRFVYALDKLEPVLKIFLDEGRSWKREGVTLMQLLAKKEDKMDIAPELRPYFQELLDILKSNSQSLFPH